MHCPAATASSARILGDAPYRSYAHKLDLFSRFAAPELHRILGELRLPPGGLVLDLGCGTGAASALISELYDCGTVVGLDLSFPHLKSARKQFALPFLLGDAESLCLRDAVFDFVWSCNAINHVSNPVAVLRSLQRHLRRGGRVALAQSGFLPEMFFSWDAHLDDAVRVACHRYYRDRYGLEPEDTAGVRGIVGLMQSAAFAEIETRTYVIERTQPLSREDREYFQSAVFEGIWEQAMQPYLDETVREKLDSYCDPGSPAYCLDRDDFHHIQTMTICEGLAPV